MKLNRSSGILMHITSLPGPHGSGTMGKEAREFVDSLHYAGQQFWQTLPISPVSPAFGYSPYSPLSSFAGNYLMISTDDLQTQPWMKSLPSSVTNIPNPNEPQSDESIRFTDFADFDRVSSFILPILQSAYRDFFSYARESEHLEFQRFCDDSKYWLDDYALFIPLAQHFNNYDWSKWDDDIRSRKPSTMRKYSQSLKEEIQFHQFIQFIFFKQWNALKEYANSHDVKIIGDIPIYVNFDSADTWANPKIFQLDPLTLKPLKVSGVPPDYFSPTGQRWGNPLYKWWENNTLNPHTLNWWEQRFNAMFSNFDLTRVDHFRGFESYWAIPADEPTAINGQWEKGPRIDFFNALRDKLGNLPIIAEDLGIITPEVEKLRDSLQIPGMKVLQFAFDFDNKNAYLPHNYTHPNTIVYTGTHDNDTTNGWFYESNISEETRQYILNYLGIQHRNEFHWQFIRLALRSTAALSIFPLQDILGYGASFRMNTPGVAQNNWTWKLTPNRLTPDILDQLKQLCHIYNRLK